MSVLAGAMGPTPVFNSTSGAWGPPGAVAQVYLPCAVTAWGPTSVTCTAPPGLDAAVAARLTAGGQAVVATQRTGYSPPVLAAAVPVQALGTPGGGLVVVTGTGFPATPWPVVVLVGGAECAVVSRNDTAITCRAPRGAGRALVAVSTPLQSSAVVPGLSVVYAAPEVDDVAAPLGRSIDGGFPLVVRGRVRSGGTLLSQLREPFVRVFVAQVVWSVTVRDIRLSITCPLSTELLLQSCHGGYDRRPAVHQPHRHGLGRLGGVHVQGPRGPWLGHSAASGGR